MGNVSGVCYAAVQVVDKEPFTLSKVVSNILEWAKVFFPALGKFNWFIKITKFLNRVWDFSAIQFLSKDVLAHMKGKRGVASISDTVSDSCFFLTFLASIKVFALSFFNGFNAIAFAAMAIAGGIRSISPDEADKEVLVRIKNIALTFMGIIGFLVSVSLLHTSLPLILLASTVSTFATVIKCFREGLQKA